MKSVGKEKKGKLAQHFSSQAHKAALSDLAQFAHNMKHVDVMLNKQLTAAKIQEEENNQRNQDIIKILLDIAKTLGRQQLAFRGTNDDADGNFLQITNLVARHNSHLKNCLSNEKMKPYSVKYLSAISQMSSSTSWLQMSKAQLSMKLNQQKCIQLWLTHSKD